METTFHNVTITIEAENPKQAYAVLCEMFHPLVSKGELEYTTDSYIIGNGNDMDQRDISELFPSKEEMFAEPKTLTREEAIEKLIEKRLSNWDSDDTDEAIRTGRYGYVEFSNAVLEELLNHFFEEVVTITGQEPELTVKVKKAEHDNQAETYKQMLDGLKLLQAVKGPVTFEDGWATLEDGTEICLNDLIAQAEGRA